jgi:hypothetical protein
MEMTISTYLGRKKKRHGELHQSIRAHLLIALELGGGVLQRTPMLLDGLKDHLGVNKK